MRFAVPLVTGMLLLALPVSGQPPGTPDLIQRYRNLQPEEEGQRRALIEGIAASASALGRDFLRAELATEARSPVRVLLLTGLARFPEDTVLSLYLDVLRGSAPYLEKRTVLTHLSGFPFDWAAYLRSYVREEANHGLRQEALLALAGIGDQATFRYLAELLTDQDSGLRLAALRALDRGYGLAAIYPQVLVPLFQANGDQVLRQEALRILSAHRDERFFNHLEEMLARGDQGPWKASCMGWCAVFGDLRALRLMVRLLDEGDPRVTAAFVAAAEGMTLPEVTGWFREVGAAHPDPAVRRAAVAHLRRRPDPGNAPVLMRLALDPHAEVASEAAAALGEVETEEVSRFLQRLSGHRDPQLAADALRAWWRCQHGSAAVVAACREAARRSESWQMRVAAIDLLRQQHAASAEALLRQNCSHASPQVRGAAYEALTWVRTRETVDFLVERLEKEKGRAQTDLVDALLDLTGFDYGRNVELWRSWWKRVRAEYPLPPKPEKRRRSAPAAGYATYYGIAVRSDRVAFLIDTSGSMAASQGSETRLERAKANLAAVLESFPPQARFNVIAFDTRIRTFKDQLIPATRAVRQEALAWLRELKPTGGTNIYDSLVLALDLEAVDTVFLLSDGAPSAGAVVDMNEIVRLISQRNRYRRIRINTVGIGMAGAAAEFLRRLAAENFGECTQGS